MNSPAVLLDDKDFLKQFEDNTLDPAQFNHLGHLRLAWLYLNDNALMLPLSLFVVASKSMPKAWGLMGNFI